MFGIFSKIFQNEKFLLTLKFFIDTWFIWVPALLIFIAWDLWVQYKRAQYIAKQTFVLLEIKLPKEIFKSPRAAEFFISGMYQTAGEKNWYEKYWKGQTRSTFSLEIVSIDGVVHFFVWTKNGHKSQIEANLYSQYPGIEIYEVPDFTLPFKYDPEVSTFWASEFELTKPDSFPIKTYIDYGMDKDPKEEYKIDPLTPLIEFLGSLGKGNQVWIQIILRAHKAEEKDTSKTWGNAKIWSTFKPSDIWDRWEKKDFRWKEGAQKEIDDIITKAKGEKGPDGKFVPGTGRQLTEVEKETVSALSRSVSKAGFDVGLRVVYTAPIDTFQITNLGGIIGGITHFNSHLNGFRPVRGSEERYKHFMFAWMKRNDKKRTKEKQQMLDAYKRRAYFYKPFRSPHFVLNSEELATIYHFPGIVSGTPTFSRIESRKSEAPTNIPT